MTKVILRVVLAAGLLTGAVYAISFNSKQECHAFCVNNKQLRFDICQGVGSAKQDCLKNAQEDFQNCLNVCDVLFP